MEFDERELRLPAWARETIRNLRRRLDEQSEPLRRELAKLRPQVELLQRRNEALTELLQCAARGGHTTAAEIIETLGECNLVLGPKES